MSGMRFFFRPLQLLIGLAILWSASSVHAEDALALIRKAASRSTLNQSGTHPFHLHATVVPSPGQDEGGSGRSGDIEIWWQSPGVYRRELRSASFHQIEIVNGAHDWQANEGDYMPEWLDDVAREILNPLPADSAAMKGVAPTR
jgi:hypothetical protein